MNSGISDHVQTPKNVPVFLPSSLVGKVTPRELAVIFALQSCGANIAWLHFELNNLSRISAVNKNQLVVVLFALLKKGYLAKKKIYVKALGKIAICYKLRVWENDENDIS